MPRKRGTANEIPPKGRNLKRARLETIRKAKHFNFKRLATKVVNNISNT